MCLTVALKNRFIYFLLSVDNLKGQLSLLLVDLVERLGVRFLRARLQSFERGHKLTAIAD